MCALIYIYILLFVSLFAWLFVYMYNIYVCPHLSSNYILCILYTYVYNT